MQYSELWIDSGGSILQIRPVEAADAPALEALIARLSHDDRRWRFNCAMNGMAAAALQRMVQIDPQTSVAFVIEEARGDGRTLLADARWVVDDSDTTAEFGLFVDPEWRRRRLGERCMRMLGRAARWRGLQRMHGYVCAENFAMLALMHHCGFERHRNPHDATLIDASLHLGPAVATWHGVSRPIWTN